MRAANSSDRSPAKTRWLWLSTNPGMTALPPRSMVSSSASSPTEVTSPLTMSSSLTAATSGRGAAGALPPRPPGLSSLAPKCSATAVSAWADGPDQTTRPSSMSRAASVMMSSSPSASRSLTTSSLIPVKSCMTGRPLPIENASVPVWTARPRHRTAHRDIRPIFRTLGGRAPVTVRPSPWAGHRASTHVTGERPRARRARRDSARVTCQPPTGPATSLQPTGSLAPSGFQHPSTDEISVDHGRRRRTMSTDSHLGAGADSTRSLAGRTIIMSGGSRGIGLAIALRAAQDGANVASVAKTAEPHPKLEGTVYTAAEQIEAAGGKALPIIGDVRDDSSVAEAVAQTAETFGGIDIVVNNASAIDLSPTADLAMKKFDLMHSINSRGSFLLAKTALPHLKASNAAHVITLSPPLNLNPEWAGKHLGYTMAKYGMSLVTLGMAEELKDDGVAANCLWPHTTIATAAVNNLLGGAELMARSRTPQIVADAAWAVLTSDPRQVTGNFFIDDELLRERGVTDFSVYAHDTSRSGSIGHGPDDLELDLFLDE